MDIMSQGPSPCQNSVENIMSTTIWLQTASLLAHQKLSKQSHVYRYLHLALIDIRVMIVHKLHPCAKRLKCISRHQIYYNTPLSTNLTGKSTLLALKYSQTFFPSVS